MGGGAIGVDGDGVGVVVCLLDAGLEGGADPLEDALVICLLWQMFEV